MAEHDLTEVLDAFRILSDQKDRKILDASDDRTRLPFDRRLAPADEARLVGFDFDEHPVPHFCVNDDSFDGCYFHIDVTSLR